MRCPYCNKIIKKFNPTVYIRLWRKRNPEKQKAIQRRQDAKREAKRHHIKNIKLYQEIDSLIERGIRCEV